MPIQDVALRTSCELGTIETGGERVSGRFVLAARYDYDDDDCNFVANLSFVKFLSIYLFIHFKCSSFVV